MAGRIHVQRVQDFAAEIAQQNAFARDLVEKSLAVLRTPVPDTFMGRKTQEPFPKETD